MTPALRIAKLSSWLVAAAFCAACAGPQTEAPPAPAATPVDNSTTEEPAEPQTAAPSVPEQPLPMPEVAESPPSDIGLPPVPVLKAPSPLADGSHLPGELLVVGNQYLDQDIEVTGYVVWIYDCVTAIREPGMSRRQAKKLVRTQPERCSRPNLYIADKPNMPAHNGIWVVEIPRPPRADEKKVLPKADLAKWPKVPSFKVGQKVRIKGTWATQSPKGFASSTGLLVYRDGTPL